MSVRAASRVNKVPPQPISMSSECAPRHRTWSGPAAFGARLSGSMGALLAPRGPRGPRREEAGLRGARDRLAVLVSDPADGALGVRHGRAPARRRAPRALVADS